MEPVLRFRPFAVFIDERWSEVLLQFLIDTASRRFPEGAGNQTT